MYFSGLKALKTGHNDIALPYFQSLLQRKTLTLHEIAVTASTLSVFYTNQDNIDKAIELLALAAIADIKTSTKETSATFILANLLYKKNDVKNASVCIEQAIAESTFYGARQRKVQVSAILPLIEAEKISIVESQKKILLRYAVTVTLLLLLVIGLGVIIYKQVQRLKSAQRVISAAHEKEQAINRQLAETNDKLSDANKIKEQYIGYFFNINAAFYEKIEKFKKSVDKKINDRKLDDIRQLTNAINLKNEKEELLKQFDHAFLKLFPNFITTFNSLFRDEDRIVLEDHELMNTDLRIFALIRMGIHDTDKIAHILQYSVNTINTYKTRVKNKSVVVNEEFEKKIMEIKAV
jgi:DNA-binding CsgD family transcriptional regulator